MSKEAIHNNMNRYGAGVLDAGKALVRRLSPLICNERATLPAAQKNQPERSG